MNAVIVESVLLLTVLLTQADMSQEEDDNSMSESSDVLWSITWPFLKSNHYTMTISCIRDGSEDYCGSFADSKPPHFTMPITRWTNDLIFGDFENQAWAYANSLLVNTQECYVHIVKDMKYARIRLLFSSIINENAYGIYVLYQGTSNDLRELLKFAWEEYKMLNILAVAVQEEPTSTPGPLDENALYRMTDFILAKYDPFLIVNSEQGHFHEWHVTSQTVHRIIEDELRPITDAPLKDARGYQLRVVMTEIPGIVEPIHDPETWEIRRYTNLEGKITDTLVRRMNFTSKYLEASASEDGVADLGGNLRAITYNGRHEHLFPIHDVRFWFLMPVIGERTRHTEISFYHIFDAMTSLYLALTYSIVVMMMWSFQKLRPGVSPKKSLTQISLDVFVLFIVSPQRLILRCLHEKAIYVSLALFALLISTFYQGFMLRLLTDEGVSNQIETLEQLARSNLSISVHPVMSSLLNTSYDDAIFRELLAKQTIRSDVVTASFEAARDRKFAVMLPDVMCTYLWSQMHDKATGQSPIYILKDGPPARYRAQLVPRLSAYKDRFNELTMRLREGGLIQLWEREDFRKMQLRFLRHGRQEDIITGHKNKDNRLDNNINLFTMRELGIVFWSWLLYTLTAVLVLLVEVAAGRFWRRKRLKCRKRIRATAAETLLEERHTPPLEFIH